MKVYTYIIAGIWLLLISACKQDFLERAPSDLINEEEVFTNLTNAEAFLNNAYREVPSLRYRTGTGGFFNLGSGADESAYMTGEVKSTTSFNRGDWNPVQFPLDWSWFAYYNSIRQINVFLRNYDRIPSEVGGQNFGDRRRRMYGEAHGLRAYYYFLLYSHWGEVPYLEEDLLPGGAENIYMPATSIDELIEKIDEDLKVAEEHLTPRHSEAEFGRLNSAAIKALRSRLYLYYASPLSNPDGNAQKWEKAASEAKAALEFAEGNSYALSLTNNGGNKAYERIFMEMTNPEILWSSYSPYESGGRDWNGWGGALADYGWAAEGPLQEMVDAYEMTNGELPISGYDASGLPVVNTSSGYDPQNPFINRDSRFYQTIIHHGATWKGRVIDVSAPNGNYYDRNNRRTNYYWRKYMQEDFNIGTGTGFSPRRFVLFRLSELYLNYAEALNESLSVPSSDVYNAVDAIRTRAGQPNLPTGLSKEEMRDRIRQERRVEFALENHRFYDIMRWKIAENVINGDVHGMHLENGTFTYPKWSERVFDSSKHYFFPIPQDEIDKNKGTLEQNPNW